jgi:hypothetical protein
VVTAAVKPTPDDPRPVVEIARGAVNSTYRNIWDLATDGSPINKMFMSLEDEVQQDCFTTQNHSTST